MHSYLKLSSILLLALFAVTCSSPPASPTTPPQPTIAPTVAAATPTRPAASPTAAPPAPAPAATATRPAPTPTAAASTGRAEIVFGWDPSVVPPSDQDDVAVLVAKLKTYRGVISGLGDEQGISIIYDPSVLTVQQLMDIMRTIGHPVIRK